MCKNGFINYRHAVAIAIMLLGLRFQATTALGQNNQNGNSAARVGIDASTPAPMTLNEAIRLALANNNDIATSRIDGALHKNFKEMRGKFEFSLRSSAYLCVKGTFQRRERIYEAANDVKDFVRYTSVLTPQRLSRVALTRSFFDMKLN